MSSRPLALAPPPTGIDVAKIERRGQLWIFLSFLACPCHLPLTIGVLATVFAGTSLGAVLRDNIWLAGGITTVVWVLGTGYGFRLLHRAQRANGACALPPPPPTATAPASS